LSGVWGRQYLDLVNEIGRRIAAATHVPRLAAFLCQRSSAAAQLGNEFAFWRRSSQATSLSALNEESK